jgi:hypothetical protein
MSLHDLLGSAPRLRPRANPGQSDLRWAEHSLRVSEADLLLQESGAQLQSAHDCLCHQHVHEALWFQHRAVTLQQEALLLLRGGAEHEHPGD